MKNLNLYLTFNGNCEEALNFYQDALGGGAISIQRFGEAPTPTPKGEEQKIMHAEFRAEGIYFMASDTMPGQPAQAGNNISLSINLDDAAEQHSIFNKLAAGGRVDMPLENTFWGAEFGMLTDKFGIHWLLNRETGVK